MDFWAQHKDFILKVLAGLGVFLVALIARGITYGDELEMALATNTRMENEIRRLKVADIRDIQAVESDRDGLKRSAETIAGQIGFRGTFAELEIGIIERILGYLGTSRRDPDSIAVRARQAKEQIDANLNGGFGELRGGVADELADEASRLNIRLEETGFANIVDIEPEQIEQYLLQLELVTRIARYLIDAHVDAIEEFRIEQRRASGEVIPGGNPEFIREWPVRVRFQASQKAMTEIFRRLRDESPSVPIRSFRIDRLKRPRDHVSVEITVLALVTSLEVPFVKEEGQ